MTGNRNQQSSPDRSQSGRSLARRSRGARPAPSAAGGSGDEKPGRKYAGLTPEERRAIRRSRLVEAGLELFASPGYAGTTIEVICATAGVTARHFYEEFGSREELLRAVFDETVDATMIAVAEALAAASTAREDTADRVRQGVTAFVHAFLDDPRRARVVCVESVGVSADMEAHRRAVIHGFARVLQAEAERLGAAAVVREEDLTLTTRALVGAANEAMVDWLLSDQPVSEKALAAVIANLFSAVIDYPPGWNPRAKT